MNFKSQKGITGIDLVVAITIIIIAIGTITTIYVNINKTYRSTNRSSVAGKIATDIMTAIDVSYFFEIEKTVSASGVDLPVTVDGGGDITDLVKLLGSGANNLKIPVGYRVTASVDEALEPTIASKEFLKKIDIEISYLVSGERFAVEFTKYKGRMGAVVPERPTQNFDDTDTYDYTAIKYNRLNEVWETTVFGDSTWYEYREQYWPIMIRTPKDVVPLKDGQVNFAGNAEIYVWVPQMVNISGRGYCLSATVEEMTSGGLLEKNVYTYKSYEKNTIGDDAVIDEEEVHFIYDELDYSNPLEITDIVVESGWYKFSFSGTNVSAKRLGDNLNLSLASTLFSFQDGDEVEQIDIDKDIYIYSSAESNVTPNTNPNDSVVLDGIYNYPAIN